MCERTAEKTREARRSGYTDTLMQSWGAGRSRMAGGVSIRMGLPGRLPIHEVQVRPKAVSGRQVRAVVPGASWGGGGQMFPDGD